MSLEDSINNLAEALRYHADVTAGRREVGQPAPLDVKFETGIPSPEDKPAAKQRVRRTAAEIEADRLAATPAVSAGEVEKAEVAALPEKTQPVEVPLTLAAMQGIILPFFKNPAFGREGLKAVYAKFGVTTLPQTDEPAGVWAGIKAEIEKALAS